MVALYNFKFLAWRVLVRKCEWNKKTGRL